MKLDVLVVFIFFLHSCQPNVVSNAVSEVLYSGYQLLKCPLGNCCNEHWLTEDLNKLQTLLRDEVFGQHIAADIVYRTMKAHLEAHVPTKPLVMSFHGWSGSGKNHVAYLIARSLYRSEQKSPFFHHFMATVHFPHAEQAALYQDRIRSWVKGNVTACSRSLFVFDEVDKMPVGVLDGIRAYLDYFDNVDGVDSRRAIFIFLSNTGGYKINRKVNDVWLYGKEKRERLTIRHFERLVKLGAFNEEGGGLGKTSLIDKSLIDVYVPFLPMEKQHVRQCAGYEFRRQNYTPAHREAARQFVVDSLTYFPKDTELYSETGCKRVAQKVKLFMANERLRLQPDSNSGTGGRTTGGKKKKKPEDEF